MKRFILPPLPHSVVEEGWDGGRYNPEDVAGEIATLAKAEAMVVSNPEIRGGEPVIKGTRIGVYEVATMLKHGASKEQILSGYPTRTSNWR